jgi:regulator of replication initiation timing
MTDENELKAEIERLKFKNEQLHLYNDRMTDSNFELRREIQTLKKQLTEVTDDNKKISLQITELTNRLRDADF